MSDTIYTGGCQCGAIRFRAEGDLKDASICHCRMCQKAFGSFYAPLASVRGLNFNWTRGQPKHFQSSNLVRRGFCEACGTPLTYEAPDGMAIAIGAFDEPERIVPTLQYGTEGKISYVDHLPELPGHPTEEDVAALPFLAELKSFQHPDHDTDRWPEEGA